MFFFGEGILKFFRFLFDYTFLSFSLKMFQISSIQWGIFVWTLLCIYLSHRVYDSRQIRIYGFIVATRKKNFNIGNAKDVYVSDTPTYVCTICFCTSNRISIEIKIQNVDGLSVHNVSRSSVWVSVLFELKP